MRKTILFTILISIFFVSTAFDEQFEDALGRKVELNHPPQRILSLVPAVTEILFALGLEERIVAVTEYCTYPAAAKDLPTVGEYADPGLENILLFKPDLVIASADMNRPALVERLEALKIPVYVVYPHTVDETLKTIEGIGQITGAGIAAEHITAMIRAQITALQKKIAGKTRPEVLEVVMLHPLTVAGPKTFVDDVIRLAGGHNVVTEGPSRYPTWNPEALLTANPEAIIVSSYPGQPDPWQFFAQWPQLRAVKNDEIIHIEADWIHRPGPRMILGIKALAQALHPDMVFDE
ncbi:MAG: cobalamin-binding protein [Desulfuromonadales bacterium]|nr:cobalamin-binding protein [Desulfuromonadales bacterium]MBN2792819.1 cobalamin-binding protein [Desulfuromonadales bacterium]